MKTFIKLIPFVVVSACFFTGCEKDNDIDPAITGGFIASYQVAKEDILRSIPEEYINTARNNLHIAYQHTSHGTHVSKGLFGLQDYKDGDPELFGITNNNPAAGKLDFRDYAMSSYAADGEDASDLSRNETAFIQATRNYLDDPENGDINVVVWSWCSISNHDVENNYLPGMQTLINEYGKGGTKIGTGNEQRQVPVTFIFMTGHAEANNNQGEGRPGDQSELITAYCKDRGYFCLDYYGIDTHEMDDTYWEDTGDDGESDNYGGNFYSDWQQSHQLGEDYYENRDSPGGSISYGDHNSQHITANRKAYAMWWIMARIAGWDGK